jgi:hypothetical protein
VSVWAVRKLWSAGATGLDGKAELLLLVYGLETVISTGTCMWEAWLWDEKLASLGEKAVLLGGLYGAYLALGEYCHWPPSSLGKSWLTRHALAAILSVDMYARLSKRLDGVDGRKKVQ